MGRCFLTWLFPLLVSVPSAGQVPLSFQEVDKRSYELYKEGRWKALADSGKSYLAQGFDYYYLRMRIGLAWFETGNYLKAAQHFKQALEFSPQDNTAAYYLFLCYYNVNKLPQASGALEKATASTRSKLMQDYPLRKNQAGFETGPLFSNQEKVAESFDLDGPDDLWGEADIMEKGFYASGWSAVNISGPLFGTLAYSFVHLDKLLLVARGDTITISYGYPVAQHQLFASANISIGKGLSLTPAFNYILASYQAFDYTTGEDGTIAWDHRQETSNDYLVFLRFSKDFEVLAASIHWAYATLNDEEQYQAGFGLTALPFGNLNFYFNTGLLVHINAGEINPVWDQMIGFKIARPIWSEVSFTAGKLTNYFEKGGYVVYNIPDEIRFKSGVRLIATISRKMTLTMEYDYLSRRMGVVQYRTTAGENGPEVQPATTMINFNNDYLLGGIQWKF
jgi:tetratricopeptide (TPR) repeat protein